MLTRMSLLVKHLMKVACGLNSLVVGEVEILGQIKKAYETALITKSIGKRLDRLLQLVFKTAKSVRFNTNISKSPISIASIAVRLSVKIFFSNDMYWRMFSYHYKINAFNSLIS